MAAATMTVTGVAGSAKDVTAQVFTNVQSYNVDVANAILSINQSGYITQIAIGAATTFTTTISGGNFAVTVS